VESVLARTNPQQMIKSTLISHHAMEDYPSPRARKGGDRLVNALQIKCGLLAVGQGSLHIKNDEWHQMQ
jgi:hypothetical protein